MEFSEDTLFEGVTVKRGDEDGPAIGEVLIYEQNGQIGVSLPAGHIGGVRVHTDD